jgi:large conductance mechanosensitive channel
MAGPIGIEKAAKATQAVGGMAKEFRDFVVKQNVVALAAGVVIGGAVGKVVSGIVDDVIMPIVGALLPGQDEWRVAKFAIGSNFISYGDLIGRLVDFFIIAFVIFLVLKAFVPKPAPAAPPAATKTCPQCLETIPAEAKRCRACTSAV